mgnify:FL=1
MKELHSVLDMLVDKAPRARYHIGGGEPFLAFDVLLQAVEGMGKRSLALDYVETNASWVTDEKSTVNKLRRLREAGLNCILVSLSPFHAEHIPLAKTLKLIEIAQEELSGGAFVWMSHFLSDLASFPPEKTIDLDRLLEEKGNSYGVSLAARYSLVPGGRAGRFLASQGVDKSRQQLVQKAPCQQRLRDTSHFHVDCEGAYVPGFCGGLTLPLEEVPGVINLEKYPLLQLLSNGGLSEALDLAMVEGFYPLTHYSSPCDLCTHIRFFLYHSKKENYPELGPEQFYDKSSLPSFSQLME